MLGTDQELLAKAGKGNIPPVFFKQGNSQFHFQLRHGVAEAGLRDAQPFRRPGVMLGVSQFHKVAKMGQIHGKNTSCFFSTGYHKP